MCRGRPVRVVDVPVLSEFSKQLENGCRDGRLIVPELEGLDEDGRVGGVAV